jgi:hypothetical protein
MVKGEHVIANRNIFVWEFFGGKPEDFLGKVPEDFLNGMMEYDKKTGIAVPVGTKGVISRTSTKPIDDILWANQTISLALYSGYTGVRELDEVALYDN